MNQILFGDCRDIMSDWNLLGVKVQMCVTSPPYFGLRDYGIAPSVWGGEVHEHEWGEVGRPHHPGQVEQTKWKTATAAGAGGTAGSGQFCPCGAWLGVAIETDDRGLTTTAVFCPLKNPRSA